MYPTSPQESLSWIELKSCETSGQQSDLLKYSNSNMQNDRNGSFIEILQKTSHKAYV